MEELLEKALARRQAVVSPDTDALRLVDGAGDGLPSLILESFADRWLVSTTDESRLPEFKRWAAEQNHSCYWKQLDQQERESPRHLTGPLVESPFLIRENGMAYEISFDAGYSQGIFLDQRDNRAELRRRSGDGMRVLNTFAYTGAFSIAAAMGGAETSTLDLSGIYLEWAKRNFSHNDIDPAAHHFCKGDTFHWLKRFAKQGRKFDGIVLDPPTFSRDEHGKVFRAEKDFGTLAALAAELLAPDGWLLCSTNCRGMGLNDFQKQLRASLPRPMSARATNMPADFTDTSYLKSVWLSL